MSGIPGTTSKTIQAGDLDIAYFEAGEGIPLVLLHGGLANAAMSWGESMPRLARTYRVLAPDSRGHGGTNNPQNHLGYDQMADDVAGFCAALSLDRPVIIGYSDGAQIGLEFGLRHPGKARALVLGGVISEPTPIYLEGLRNWGFVAAGEVDYERLASQFGPFFEAIKTEHGLGDPDYWQRFLPQISRLWVDAPAYSETQLKSIGEPTLVIQGDRDDMAGFDQARRLYENIPNASHDAGNKPVFWNLVEDFLGRHA